MYIRSAEGRDDGTGYGTFPRARPAARYRAPPETRRPTVTHSDRRPLLVWAERELEYVTCRHGLMDDLTPVSIPDMRVGHTSPVSRAGPAAK